MAFVPEARVKLHSDIDLWMNLANCFALYLQGMIRRKTETREHILPVNLFQGCTDDFNGEEFEEFVAHIKWRIKYKVPANIKDFSKELRDET